MKEVLNTMVQALGDQAIALGTVADQVAALKRTLARQFPELADELKQQIETEQEKNRSDVYDLQVGLAKLKEAILLLPEKQPDAQAGAEATAGTKAEKKGKPPKAAAGDGSQAAAPAGGKAAARVSR